MLMSVSKSLSLGRRRVSLVVRQVHTQSATKSEGETNLAKMSARSQFRNMSASQWKLLIQLKDYLTKASNDNSFLFVLNREWISLLQKLPSIYGQVEKEAQIHHTSVASAQQKTDDIHRTSSTLHSTAEDQSLSPKSTVTEPEISSPGPSSATQAKQVTSGDGESYTFPQVLNGLKLKINSNQKDVSESTINIPSWKPKKETISKTSITSRTRHVISSIANAESVQSRQKRLEDLASHLLQYPEAKNLAVKEGAIKMLLRLRHETVDEGTLRTLREAFALLGYVEPLRGRGIRILSIDGGGIRGVLVIEMLKKLEQLTGKKVYELFDYICGVSTGAILAGLIGIHKKNLDEVSVLYKELSTKIFTQNTFWGTSNLVWSHSYYDTDKWEEILKKNLGEMPLIKSSLDPDCPKISAVSTVVNKSRVMAYIFRNYSLPHRVQSTYLGGHHHQVWEAVRASAAAPFYFEEFKTGELLHQDGGILVNNPAAVAIHESRQLWPTSSIQCVLSLGTGRFNPTQLSEMDSSPNTSSWKTKFMKILDSATDTEAVHTVLNDLMPASVYHRFNPYITEMVTMDEISPEKISQLELDAAMYFRRNEDKFQDTARALLQKRSLLQRCQDWFNLQRDILL